MGTYTISEVAERSGFSASALRYYEGVGLVVPAARTASGYRLYGDEALDRLAFVARAKQLGCTLGEIGDLLGILDGERCAPVQRRLHDLVTAKITAAERQVTDGVAMAARLRVAAGRLGEDPVDGPCTDGCACAAPLAGERPPAEMPMACTLEADEVPGRRQAWAALLTSAEERSSTDGGGVCFRFGHQVGVEPLAALVAAEQACCAFFSFTITVDGEGVSLTVRAPEAAAGILAELVGQPA